MKGLNAELKTIILVINLKVCMYGSMALLSFVSIYSPRYSETPDNYVYFCFSSLSEGVVSKSPRQMAKGFQAHRPLNE